MRKEYRRTQAVTVAQPRDFGGPRKQHRAYLRLTIMLFLALVGCLWWPVLARARAATQAQPPLIVQEIRYRVADARQVFLVWGINGWALVSEEQRPAGTVVKDKLMYTPMERDGDSFVARMRVPAGATIDYVFQLIKNDDGESAEAWDTNKPQKDYHTVAEGRPVVVQARLETSEQGIGAVWWAGAAALLSVLGLWLVGLRRQAAVSQAYVSGEQRVALQGDLAVGPGQPARVQPQSGEQLLARLGVLPIVLIVVLGAALRLYQVTQPFTDAFSWRETSVAMMADNYLHRSWNIFYPEVSWYGPGPGYQGREFQTVSYTAALLYLVFGQQDWIGRGVAILFGLWGIFALYQLVRRTWDEPHALAAAAVMAVLPGAVIVDRSFLPDPAMVALVVTSFWMFIVYLQTERLRYLLLAAVIGAWGFSTKIPGLIVGLPMAYAALAILGRRAFAPRKLLAFGAFAVLTLAPVAAYYLWARHLARSYPPYHFAGDGNWLWQDGLARWIEQDYFLPKLVKHYVGWIWTAPVIALFAIGLVSGPPNLQAQGDARGKPRWLFHLWFLAGLIYYCFGAQELTENPWNFHVVNPAAAVLAGHALIILAGLARQAARWAAWAVPALALALILVYGQAGLADWYKPYSAQSYQMGLALDQVAQPADLVVTVGHSFGDPVAIYYSQRRGWGFPPADPAYAWDRLPENDGDSIRFLEELRAKGAGWLGIVGEHRKEIWQEHPALASYIERTCELTDKTDDYSIYRIRAPGELAK
jgi:4-amino-4-deoxy-L-arabinose transferase-like glycosyltransferase